MSRRERQRRRRRNRGSPVTRFFALTAVLVAGGAAVAAIALAGWVVNVANSAPNLSSYHAFQPGSPSEVFAANGKSLGYIWSPDVHYPVAGSEIPQILKNATIAIEDRRFYQHGALDYQGIVRAAIKDTLGGSSLQGASTLTMQLIDNRYLYNTPLRTSRTIKYKITQAKLAMQLYAKHSKPWILDAYLNSVPYGTVGNQTAYGVDAAADLFFNKRVQDLSLPQAALLAGLPQAPTTYNPFVDPAAAKARRAEVLRAMVASGYITQAQANRANHAHLELHHDQSYLQHQDPYVFDFIQQQVAQDLCPKDPKNCQLLNDGLKIYTTIDLRKQAIALQSIQKEASLRVDQAPGYGNAAAGLASIDDANGHILAIANSSTYAQTKFDYATEAHRQPGSSFKVFALMTLIHDYDGDPNQTYYDSKFLPAGWYPGAPTWSVHTAEETYQGTINITKATIVSDNTVFAQLAVDLGMDKFDAIAHAMGITSPLDANPAEVIGGLKIGVTPLEMADAYATLANGGIHIPPTIINKVVFPDGSKRDFGHPKGTRVFPYDEAYEATSVLKQVITSGTGTKANYGCPAGGKTGTANALANAWFVGYTPRMSTAVWVGYPQGNLPMNDGYGGDLAAPIWHDYMQSASGNYCGDWVPPAVPFQGTAFLGPHSVAPNSSPPPGKSKNTTGTGGAGVGTGTATTPGQTGPGTGTNSATTPAGGATQPGGGSATPPAGGTSPSGGGAPTGSGGGGGGGSVGNGH
ncbi:MAG: transglycosylase domain-containing protein [Solirubrobacteraceae bacterium]